MSKIKDAALWFEHRASVTPMAGARAMFELAADALHEKAELEAKPQTNADRIRAMSDEELADLIVKHHPMHAWNKQVRETYFSFDVSRKDNPRRAWLEWFKRPAE